MVNGELRRRTADVTNTLPIQPSPFSIALMSRPAQIRFLNRFAPAYDPVVQLMGFGALWRALAEVAAPAPGERALDVCTGTGGAAWELWRRGAHVVGLDLAAGMLRRAGRKPADNGHAPPLYARMDARQLAFPDRAFPLVTCSMALHEMGERERAQVLSEIVRVASSRVVIADYRVPRGFGAALLFRATHSFEYFESDDFREFLDHDLSARIDGAGLTVGTAHDVGAYRIWSCRAPT
jgi:ubiquinone/menaquinone biosynthesis C-methylase UbiE